MSSPRRRLSICADDFGLSAAISRSITGLAQRGRLNAVSCLTNSARWPEHAQMLSALPPSVERGLHLNLTDGTPLSAELRGHWPCLPALPKLIVMAHVGRLPLQAITSEWQAQWQRFVDTVGEAPRFVDGHQHVHHLPGVRDVVLAALAAVRKPIAARNTGCVRGPGNALKRVLIERTGGRSLQRRLQDLDIAHNSVLLGVYDFRDQDYRGRVQRWLARAPAEGGLLFCHPAADVRNESGHVDPIAPARLREHDYLASDAFEEDLMAGGVTLGPGWTRRPSPG
jgi:predicted glycoside hydrolase/deacetylase ChbG (UPF0249 family)